MYYGSSSPYTGSPYSYSSSVSPIGSSYSASYLNPGGNYSNHSSLGGYSRAPLTSRWITSSGRNYSPILSTITERGSASPVRINSPRRLPLSSRTYHSSTYTPRPVNINTADIDVSKDKYRHKVEPPQYQIPPSASHQNSNDEHNKGPFMPRVDGKAKSDTNSPSEVKRGTIQRGRTVVRLYTVKRKERDSPRKPVENQQSSTNRSNQQTVENDDVKTDEKEFMKWREKLSEDLAYKEKKEKKTLGAKLAEKFMVKNENDKTSENTNKVEKMDIEDIAKMPATSTSVNNFPLNNCLNRRCSMELMAEQANLLDSLIRSENLSTATLELNKVGIVENKNNQETVESLKRRKPDNGLNPIKTTKSDYSLYGSLKSHKDVRDPKNFCKRRSLKKSSSGSSIRRLDSITEFSKEPNNVNLPAIEESLLSTKQEIIVSKPKPKLKAKITSSVEVSAPKSPLKFIVENVTVEEKLHARKKEITYSSEVEEISSPANTLEKKIQSNIKKNIEENEKELPSPEPENDNFWDKIGKRETVYLMKRKKNIDEAKEKNKRTLFWFPEDEELVNSEQLNESNLNELNGKVDNNINNESTMSNNHKMLHQSNEEEKERLFDKEIMKAVEISAFPTDSDISECHVFKETTTQMNSAAEIDEKMPIPEILSLVHEKPDLTSENLPETDNVPLTGKINSYKQSKNIVKSASLEKVSDSQYNVIGQKKTKSEKSKKTLNIENVSETSPLQVTTPINKKDLLEDDIAVVDKIHSNVDNKQETIKKLVKNPDTQKVVCSLPPSGLQEVEEQNKEPDKIKVPCPIHPFGLQNVKTAVEESENNKLSTSQDNISNSTLDSTIITSTSTDGPEKIISNNPPQREQSKEVSSVIKKQAKDLVKTAKNSVESTKVSEINKTDTQITRVSNIMSKNNYLSMSKDNISSCENKLQIIDFKISDAKKSLKMSQSSSEIESKNIATRKQIALNKNNNNDKKSYPKIDDPTNINQPSTAPNKPINIPDTSIQKTANMDTTSIVSSSQNKTKAENVLAVAINLSDIPIETNESKPEEKLQSKEKTNEENKAENNTQKDDKIVEPIELNATPPLTITPKKVVKEEKALRPLIATPRPLQKKAPQVIHSSDSSDTSSEEETSEDEDDSDSSEGSGEFFECENNTDGRTSTGSNDSGFDSSAPASPATFSQIKKGEYFHQGDIIIS